MKVMIIGGTGFLGYYASKSLLAKGHKVSTFSLPDIELGDWYPKEVAVSFGNVFEMDDAELQKVHKGYDAMVYAVGPDDRVTPQAPAYEFFHERLVEACVRVVNAAREAGIQRSVVLGSYFSYFDEIQPEKQLTKYHSYIRVRRVQETAAIAAGQGKMDVCVLRLPYIFGTMPEREPIWKDLLIARLIKDDPILYPKGGTAMLSVEAVGEAVAGAVERGEHGKTYPVSDVNLSWNEMLGIMLDEMGLQKKIVNVPKFLAVLGGRQMKKEHEAEGKESGLDPIWLMRQIMTDYLYIDADETKQALGYKGGGIEESIRETVRRCLE